MMLRRLAIAFSVTFVFGFGCVGQPDAESSGDGGVPTSDGGAVESDPDAAGTGLPTDECGDIRVSPKVYYGTEAPTYVPLTPGQVLAIGTWGGCSGTFITPEWILTAEHCGLSAGADFCVGTDPDNANICFNTVQVVDAPGDMTLARIDGDATVDMPGLVPIPILTEDMNDSWIGRTGEASGYGQQEDGSYGEREFTAQPIVQLWSDNVTIDGEGQRGVCFGDSGGPLMAIANDGTVRVIGALSNGDGSCVDRDNYTRVDTYRDWIESYTGETIIGGADCGEIDPIGRCSDGMAMWCGADGVLETSMCANGTSCGWDVVSEGFRCIEGPDPCGGFDNFGACENNTARWCENGVQRERDCDICGQTCDSSMASAGAYCF